MEEPIQITNPPNTSQNTKKRPLENGHIDNSNYFKIRAIAKDIRAHIIRVLKTQEFRNCVAAQEIRDQKKVMMNLYKEMMAETISITRCTNMPETHTALPSENPETQKVKQGANTVADKLNSSADPSEDPQSDDNRPQGTFIVGGSDFGWNFITYPGGKSVYYGRTKEIFRAENVVVRDDIPKEEFL